MMQKKIELLEAEDDEEESQIIKLGRAALKKMNNHSNSLQSVLSTDKSPSARCSLFQMVSCTAFVFITDMLYILSFVRRKIMYCFLITVKPLLNSL